MGQAVPADDLPDSPSAVPDDDLPESLKSAPSGYEHMGSGIATFIRHPLTTGIGMAENALSGISSGAGSLMEAMAGIPAATDAGEYVEPHHVEPGSISSQTAYRPRTAAGQELAQVGAHESDAISRAYDELFGTGNLATTIKQYGPEALGATSTVAGVAGLPEAFRGTPLPESPMAGSQQSISAAAASPNLSAATPQLRAAVARASQTSTINPEVLGRHLEADSLPVPIRLTEGQATQNPSLLSAEQNARGKFPAYAQRFNEQNSGLIQNLQEIRDRIGPDVFSTNQVEHGDTLISAYKAKNDAAQADISAKYQALQDANGGKFPVDAQTLQTNVNQALHQKLLYEHAPSAPMAQLDNAAKNGMTFEQYEAMRTNLARVMRSSSDGNERAAAGVIRQQMEDLPLSGDTAKLKPLADAARSAARAQFQALDADPAYKAAVTDSVPPDRFVQKYVIGGNRDDVDLMRHNLGDNPTAVQTMGVAAVDHLRNSASGTTGNFSQAGYNRQLSAIDPKLSALVDPKTADQLVTVGNVARYTQAQPRGSYVNNSNTFTAAAADKAAGLLEAVVNAKTAGVGGTIGRRFLQNRAANKAVQKTLEPGAGLTAPLGATP